MNREHIISEIQRTAKANGGVPLGRKRFERETGIPAHAWYGKHWTTWSDALREAGFQPNKPLPAYEPSFLIEKLVGLTRQLGRAPVGADLSFAKNRDSTFPCKEVFLRRLGPKPERVDRVLAFCQRNAGYDDVAALWTRAALQLASPPAGGRGQGEGGKAIGYVYLLKHGTGRDYKIGRTRNPLRRVGEVAFELPEESEPVHYIETDDPTGVESYWHARFKTKRKRGEWFALTAHDVRAFRRWKRIH